MIDRKLEDFRILKKTILDEEIRSDIENTIKYIEICFIR